MNQLIEAWKEIPDLPDEVSPLPDSEASSKGVICVEVYLLSFLLSNHSFYCSNYMFSQISVFRFAV